MIQGVSACGPVVQQMYSRHIRIRCWPLILATYLFTVLGLHLKMVVRLDFLDLTAISGTGRNVRLKPQQTVRLRMWRYGIGIKVRASFLLVGMV